MKMKKIISLCFIFFTIFLIASSTVYAEDDRSYTIDKAVIHLFLNENGSLHVSETYTYSFSGTYNGVYRDIPIKSGETLNNVKIFTKGAFNRHEILNKNDKEKQIKIYLFSDEGKTSPISDTKVDVTIEYDFLNVLKSYDDVMVLSYKLWGENWEVKVGELETYIHFKSSDNVKYWVNPDYLTKSHKWLNKTTLYISAKDISPGTWYEFRTAVPKNQFDPNPQYAEISSGDALPILEKQQKDYENGIKFKENFFGIIAIILFLSILIPIGIYLKYGREPKITYSALYEREIPTDDSPAMVNALYSSSSFKSIGTSNLDGFLATLMDLIDRGYLSFNKHEESIETIEDNKIKIDANNGELKINKDKDLSPLEEHERSAINILTGFSTDSHLNLDDLNYYLSDETGAEQFKDDFSSWKSNFENYIANNVMDNIFIEKGDTLLKIYGFIAALIGLIVGANYFFTSNPMGVDTFLLISGIFVFIAGVVSFLLPNGIGGRWTEYGATNSAKWQNFKKYLTDFSLIKEYPPESVIIWNKYLVYGTALGVADKVHESMEKIVPEDKYLDGHRDNDLFLFYTFGYSSMYSSFNTGINYSPDSGTFGDIGGGSGGGGGGAF